MEDVAFESVGKVAFEGERVFCLGGGGAFPDDFFSLAEDAESIGGDLAAVAAVVPGAEEGVAGEIYFFKLLHFDRGDFSKRGDLAEADVFELDRGSFGLEAEEAGGG